MIDNEIHKSIEKYIEARKNILAIGRKYPERIGGNDNIIGRIGEFFAIKFLESLGQNPKMAPSSSNPGYDLEQSGIQTQVKVITSENKNGRNVRLKKPWTQFLLIELGENYKPKRIGLITEAQHQIALNENKTWSLTPYAKLTMLGNKGLIGKYGKVYSKDEMPI